LRRRREVVRNISPTIVGIRGAINGLMSRWVIASKRQRKLFERVRTVPVEMLRTSGQAADSPVAGRALARERFPSDGDQDLDRLALVHRAVAVGDPLEVDDAVEHATRLDPAFDDVG
jgi:hypothetical protein